MPNQGDYQNHMAQVSEQGDTHVRGDTGEWACSSSWSHMGFVGNDAQSLTAELWLPCSRLE